MKKRKHPENDVQEGSSQKRRKFASESKYLESHCLLSLSLIIWLNSYVKYYSL